MEFSVLASASMPNYLSLLLDSRTLVHQLHLGTTGEGSYARHTALGSYYDSIGTFIDRLTEHVQGNTGTLITFPYSELTTELFSTISGDVIGYFESLKDISVKMQTVVQDDPGAQNILAEIHELTCSTLYKLRFLK